MTIKIGRAVENLNNCEFSDSSDYIVKIKSIIEIKKSTSKISCNYDKLKLKCYTSIDNGNDLNYDLGVFIKFSTGVSEPTYELKWYWNGKEIQEETHAIAR